MQDTLNKLYLVAIDYGMKIVFALILLVVGRWTARIAANVTHGVLRKAKLNDTLSTFLKNIVYFGILIFVVIAALSKLGVETTSFVALIGAAGLAVGLALQGSLANFAAGVMIVVFTPFEVGDHIEAAGAAGEVEEIQIFNIILKGQDNKKIIIPNAKITADKVVVTPRNNTVRC